MRSRDTELELEGELEFEEEGMFELEGEGEGEEFLGTIARGIGGLLGANEFEEEGEFEEELYAEFEGEEEGEFEGEYEGEEFFRRFRSFARRAAPVLRRVARAAAPAIGAAVGGPAGGMIGRGIAMALREEEGEFEAEFEEEGEYEGEEYASRAAAEMMAAAASRVSSEAEAEAFAGAASMQVLSARDRRALAALLPHLVRGTAVLTRILRRSGTTRPAVRAIPTIVQRSAMALRRRAQSGLPVNRQIAGRVLAAQTQQVLGSPAALTRAVGRNVRATAQIARPAVRGGTPGGGSSRRLPAPGTRGLARTASGRIVPARVVPVTTSRRHTR
jgi:hypothetical protein